MKQNIAKNFKKLKMCNRCNLPDACTDAYDRFNIFLILAFN